MMVSHDSHPTQLDFKMMDDDACALLPLHHTEATKALDLTEGDECSGRSGRVG